MTDKNNPNLGNEQHILHPATSITQLLEKGPRIIERGKGVHIYDDTGHKLIDGIAGLWCVNVGYGRTEIAEAMATGASELGYYHTFGAMSNQPQIELSQTLIDMTPAKLTKVFFGSSGSDANDTLVKIVWHYNNLKGREKKKKIISRMNAYHGTSISAASLTGLKGFHNAFDLPIKNILHTDCPHYYRYHGVGESEEEFSARMAQNLENMIIAEGPDTVAAFIAEPIMGAGGVINPPKGYFKAIKAVLKKYDILMIADEV
ncbi:MAG: aminotransferase class III-fold pyridoxal phosphate-dependent enzyme, partial [Sphingomonadales bacterium]|nr:aminotransferase class III-fold pyridoxal phosphate-dependent enzyme [Sphingomonadales bacterium]